MIGAIGGESNYYQPPEYEELTCCVECDGQMKLVPEHQVDEAFQQIDRRRRDGTLTKELVMELWAQATEHKPHEDPDNWQDETYTADCDFVGDVDGYIEGGMFFWTCPKCGGENETAVED